MATKEKSNISQKQSFINRLKSQEKSKELQTLVLKILRCILVVLLIFFVIAFLYFYFVWRPQQAGIYLKLGQELCNSEAYEDAAEAFMAGGKLGDEDCIKQYCLLALDGHIQIGEDDDFMVAVEDNPEIISKKASDELSETNQKILDENALIDHDKVSEIFSILPNIQESFEAGDKNSEKRLCNALYEEAKAYYMLAIAGYWYNADLYPENKEWPDAEMLDENGHVQTDRYADLCNQKLTDLFKNHCARWEKSAEDTVTLNTVRDHMISVLKKKKDGDAAWKNQSIEPQKEYFNELSNDSKDDSNDMEPEDEATNSRDDMNLEDKVVYYRDAMYLKGCYLWRLARPERSYIPDDNDALHCWLISAYLGNKDAANQLAEILYYGMSKYGDGEDHYLKEWSGYQRQNKDNLACAEIFAEYAATVLDNAHAYTIWARIAQDTNEGKDTIQERIEEAKNNGDRYAGCLYFILDIEADDWLLEFLDGYNGDLESEKFYDPYAIAHLGDIAEKEKKRIEYWTESAALGCELGTYRLADYYYNKYLENPAEYDQCKELARRYAELTLVLRDIKFNEACSIFDALEDDPLL